MKKIKYLISLLAVITFTACGGGGSSQAYYEAGEVVNMEVNTTYSVNPSDKVIPLTQDTVIDVVHTIDNNTKEVTLISGSAELIRGDYTIGE
jgi:uncharacterized lipoprotein YehR (DUF1307 family)